MWKGAALFHRVIATGSVHSRRQVTPTSLCYNVGQWKGTEFEENENKSRSTHKDWSHWLNATIHSFVTLVMWRSRSPILIHFLQTDVNAHCFAEHVEWWRVGRHVNLGGTRLLNIQDGVGTVKYNEEQIPAGSCQRHLALLTLATVVGERQCAGPATRRHCSDVNDISCERRPVMPCQQTNNQWIQKESRCSKIKRAVLGPYTFVLFSLCTVPNNSFYTVMDRRGTSVCAGIRHGINPL